MAPTSHSAMSELTSQASLIVSDNTRPLVEIATTSANHAITLKAVTSATFEPTSITFSVSGVVISMLVLTVLVLFIILLAAVRDRGYSARDLLQMLNVCACGVTSSAGRERKKHKQRRTTSAQFSPPEHEDPDAVEDEPCAANPPLWSSDVSDDMVRDGRSAWNSNPLLSPLSMQPLAFRTTYQIDRKETPALPLYQAPSGIPVLPTRHTATWHQHQETVSAWTLPRRRSLQPQMARLPELCNDSLPQNARLPELSYGSLPRNPRPLAVTVQRSYSDRHATYRYTTRPPTVSPPPVPCPGPSSTTSQGLTSLYLVSPCRRQRSVSLPPPPPPRFWQGEMASAYQATSVVTKTDETSVETKTDVTSVETKTDVTSVVTKTDVTSLYLIMPDGKRTRLDHESSDLTSTLTSAVTSPSTYLTPCVKTPNAGSPRKMRLTLEVTLASSDVTTTDDVRGLIDNSLTSVSGGGVGRKEETHACLMERDTEVNAPPVVPRPVIRTTSVSRASRARHVYSVILEDTDDFESQC